MIAVLSNGAGEDAIGASIVAALQQLRPDLSLAVFPLVGAGAAYPAELERWGDGGSPPSQGLANQSWRLWLQDFRQGLLGRVLQQWRELRRRASQVRAVVAIGDLFPSALAALAGVGPIYFVGTAKSVYHHPYSWPERLMLQRWVRHSLVRDQATAQHLLQQRVAASYLGNAMLDAIVPRGCDLGLVGKVLCLFPGSRAQAPRELPRLLRIWQRLYALAPCQAAVAVADNLAWDSLCCPGYQIQARGCAQGWVGSLLHPTLPPVHLVRGALGDLLAHSHLALGQAGTAHEQAAGAGVPVVSLHPNPRGALGWYRGRQKGLLGEALQLVPEDEELAAQRLSQLLLDDRERQRLGEIGRSRMGQPGGAAKIAHWLAERL